MMKNYIDYLLDLSVVFSFDQSGYKRHCPNPLPKVNFLGSHGIITGASSGIGLAVAKSLIEQGMSCLLVGRNLDKLEENFQSALLLNSTSFSLDMADLKKVYDFANDNVRTSIDVLVHNAGAMPSSLSITKDGYEQVFASQVIGPFILTKALADLGKLKKNSRIIFVSSGGMYLKSLDLSDLLFKNQNYNKYIAYANAKRAQVILAKQFSKKYPEYLFSSMHPGWVSTPGVRSSMPLFNKLLGNRLRTSEEGADTILWLAAREVYPNGKFWFDRKEANTTILHLNKSTEEENELLWNYCNSIFQTVVAK